MSAARKTPMRTEGLVQAYHRLNQAHEACMALIDAAAYWQAEAAWSDFLIAVSGIYAKLGDAAHDTKHWAWFAAKLGERRADHFLQYVHQARNASEHSLSGSTERLGEADRRIELRAMLESPLGIFATRVEASEKPRLRLVPVTDKRYGTTFNPPAMHLGLPIAEQTPAVCASLVLIYVRALVEEAGRLLK